MTDRPMCATCRFFDPAEKIVAEIESKRGLCRVNAPSSNAAKPWPVVSRMDWCGEHPALDPHEADPT